MRSPKYFSLIAIIFFLSLLISPTLALADRGTVQLLVDPFGSQDIAGVHLASDGSLFVLDRADEIFKIDPVTGDYKGHYTISGYELYDIALQDSEIVWWTDYCTMFGWLDSETGALNYWDTTGFYTNDPNLGPLVYHQDSLWMADSLSSYNGLYHFYPQTDQLCMYKHPVNGIHAADLVMHDGDIWALDWFLDSLMRFDPDSEVWTKIVISRDIGTNAMLQTDGTDLWFTEDVDDGDFLRFNPSSLVLTVYHLPDGEQPRHFVLQGDQAVWYTNYNGSFGMIDLGNFVDIENFPLTASSGSPVTPSCWDIGDPVDDTAGLETGSLNDPTTVFNSTQTLPKTGLQSFSLDAGAAPFGIATTQDFIWISDPGRDELVRLPLEPQSDGNFIYLPLIIR